MTKNILDLETYKPDVLMDEIINRFKLRNDAKLGKLIGISAPALSRMRHKKLPIGGETLIRIYDATGMDIDEMRILSGIPTYKNIVDSNLKNEEKV